jgi:short-subunit dehydrogenase
MMSRGLTALVTGASAGIGRELALACARGGHNLVVAARRSDRLEALARDIGRESSVQVRVAQTDLSDSKARRELFDSLVRDRVSIDILINNAGFASGGRFQDADLATQLAMIELNVTALTHLTGLFLQEMLVRKRGRILNVASTAGFQPGPLMAVYYATKAYVLHFSEAIAEELTGTGVSVTVLCPGPTATDFPARAGVERSRLFSRGVLDPKVVADAGYRGMMEGKVVVIPGLGNRIGAQILRVSPRAVARKYVRRLNSGPS